MHTFGTVLRCREFDGLSVEEALMPRQLVVPEHVHEGAQIYFVLEGEYAETVQGRSYVLSPGEAWFRPPRERHANAVVGDEAALTLIVTVEGERFDSVQHRVGTPRHLRSILLDEARLEIVREMRRGDAAAATALEGWSLLLLSRAERLLCDGGGAPEWLGDAVLFIERAYVMPLSLSDVAAHVGVHPATLAAAFRRFHRTSVGEFIRSLRLRHAREALLDSRRPIKEIALDAGFYDQAHFGRCFRRRFGMSPAAFRAATYRCSN
jgi:AraC family transcriptional regulator